MESTHQRQKYNHNSFNATKLVKIFLKVMIRVFYDGRITQRTISYYMIIIIILWSG